MGIVAALTNLDRRTSVPSRLSTVCIANVRSVMIVHEQNVSVRLSDQTHESEDAMRPRT